MRGQALALVGAAAVALMAAAPVPAMAQQTAYHTYASQDAVCQQQRQNRMVAGGLMGALAGAFLGSNVAGHGARSEGGVLGAVAGAVAGGAIGRSTAKCGPYSSSYNGPIGSAGAPYARDDHGARGDDDYGLDGGPDAPTAYHGGGGYRQVGYGRRGDDGSWRAE